MNPRRSVRGAPRNRNGSKGLLFNALNEQELTARQVHVVVIEEPSGPG
jgi:hypothetical protein